MPNYLIARIAVNDDSWIPEYAANVHDIVHKHGGKYLTRSGNVTHFEGDDSLPDVVAVLEFPDAASMQAFMDDPDYRPYAEARAAGTESQFIGVDASDAAGTIPYLSGGG